jgi:aryl-alcohol dehydrogenase-like predicted oxidoreductase
LSPTRSSISRTSASFWAGKGDFRGYLPRFSGENRERNQKLIDTLEKLAADKRARGSALAIAWVLAKGQSIVPPIGARTRKQLEESLGALEITLSPTDLAQIEEAIPPSAVAGTRYDEHQMKILDSER